MKLAELLIERHDLLDLISGLERRIENNLRIQEGDTPDENPDELLLEITKALDKLTLIKTKIDTVNSTTKITENMVLNDLIIKQQNLKKKHRIINDIIEKASSRQRRYSNSEIKEIIVIDMKKYLKEMDGLAKEIRELDVQLQKLNWEIDVT